MEFKLFYYLYAAIAFLSSPSYTARILGIFPVPAKSHFNYNNAIMKSLIDAGHDVTVITPFPETVSAENYTSVIAIPKLSSFIEGFKLDELRTQNANGLLDKFVKTSLPKCAQVLELSEIQKILNSDEKLYDIVFTETAPIYKCHLYVAEKMNIPITGTVVIRSLLLADQDIHNPNHPAYIPNDKATQTWKLDNVFGRIINVWNYVVESWYKNYIIPELIKDFHEHNFDQLGSLEKYKDMVPDIMFYNSHSSLFPKPMNPNAIEIGGVHIESVKPLPKNIQKFIDTADQGVILFSLGSIAPATMLNAEVQKAFKDAFAEIPQRVIWKFEEKLENLSDNVMILDWLPQRDILDLENVIGFISHCGLGSMYEAVETATPMVACPLFCDQLDNAEILENLKVAVRLDIYNITKENILKALYEIINNSRYRHNMQELSKKFKDRPLTPQQSVVYWTEYVLRHNGAAHFKNPASRLHWFQYFLLDVILLFALILISIGCLIKLSCKFIHQKLSKLYLKLSNDSAKKTR